MKEDIDYFKLGNFNIPPMDSFYIGKNDESFIKNRNKESFEKEEKKSTFLWEKWPSKNKFICRGRLMIGPKEDRHKLYFTLVILFIFLSPYYFAICPKLWMFGLKVLTIFNILLTLLTLSFLGLVVFTDPGIIPRKKVYSMLGQPVPEKFDLHEKRRESLSKQYYVKDSLDKKSLMVKLPDGNNVLIKYCETCQIYRPPRSSHCRICDNCVEVLDHHCPYLNNCIGKRNYRYFCLFVGSLLIMAASIIVGFIFFFIKEMVEGHSDKNELDYTVDLLLVLFIGIPAIVFTICIFILFMYHLVLTYRGRTTKENINKQDRYQIFNGNGSPDWCTISESNFDPMWKLNESHHQISRIGDVKYLNQYAFKNSNTEQL